MSRLLDKAKKINNRKLRFGHKESWVNDNYNPELAELFIAWFKEEITTSQLCETIKLPTSNGGYFNRSVSVLREAIKRKDAKLEFIK